MYLERAEIKNFRGIRHLEIDFQEDSTALIGENAWGKTSLLRALWMMLGQGGALCRFSRDDLYVPVALMGEARGNAASGPVLAPLGLLGAALPQVAAPGPREALPEAPEPEAEDLDEDGREFLERELEFSRQDIYSDTAEAIEIGLTFCESTLSQNPEDEPDLRPFWSCGDDGLYRISWQVTAREENGSFTTRHDLLNRYGKSVTDDRGQVERALRLIIALSPVIRLRDSRMPTGERAGDGAHNELRELFLKFSADGALNGREISELLLVLNSLLSKYVIGYEAPRLVDRTSGYTRNIGDIVNRPISIETLSELNETLQQPGLNKVKMLLSFLSAAIFACNGGRQLSPKSRPIIILEDLEARLHPSLLLSFWSLMEALDFQKIVTTYSGDLLSAMSLYSIRRLFRRRYDTRTFKIGSKAFNREEMRRIAFHVRINRPMSLFARTWLLVEGETEVWVVSTIASLLGCSLQCAGIRIIEFAQCGLAPLMKLALQLGIEFHVLTDGDEAGQKYAAAVKGLFGGRSVKKHLTMMPHIDIEHYIYASGYQEVFRKAAGLPPNAPKKLYGTDRIIDQAIRKKSKPGLALLLVEAMRERGTDGIPPLFKTMIESLRKFSREESLF